MVAWKVGELAERTGLTVRTLHHYEELGLLEPERTEAGHRLYGAREVKRLQRVVSLRQLGFTLTEIRDCLHDPDFSPRKVLELHSQRLGEQIALQQEARQRLAKVAEHLDGAEEVSAQEFMDIIEGMVRVEKYYTPEQRETIKKRAEEAGQERIEQVEIEWPELMAQVQAEMDKGAAPSDPQVQALARRWTSLIHEFTGGDTGIGKSLNRMWSEERELHGVETAPVREMGAYLQKALEAAEK
jgi:DNA-binding transcriptional MerR regulator